MSIRDTLESTFSSSGIDADALLASLGDLYKALDLPASPLDPAAIAQPIQALADVDPSDTGALLAAAVQTATTALEHVPGAGDAVTRVTGAVAGLTALGEGSTSLVAAFRAPLESGTATATPSARVAGAMSAFGSAAGSELATVTHALAPGLDLARVGPVRDLLGAGGGIPPLVDAARSLMTLAAGMERATALKDALAHLPDADGLAALRAAVAAWSPAETVARIASGDPVDAVVADVAPALARVADLEHAIADLVAGTTSLVTTLALDEVGAAWHAADVALTALDPAPVRDLAERLVGLASGLLAVTPSSLPPIAGALSDEVASFVTSLTDAVAAVEGGRIEAGIRAGTAEVIGPLQTAATALEDLRAAIADAEAAVGDVLAAIDLGPAVAAIQAITDPVAAALAAVHDACAAVSADLATAAQAATDAITSLRDEAGKVAKTLSDAFGAVAGVLDQLDIAGRVEQVSAALQPIAAQLEAVHIADAAEAASHAIEQVAGVIDALPLELLPDSARSELDKVTGPIKSFDFDTEVRGRVAAELDTIESAIDTDVLGQVRAAISDAGAFLTSLDPTAAIADLEHEAFTPVLAAVHGVDPDVLLAPVKDAIAKIPDLSHLLDPADQAFDGLLAHFDDLAPRQLLAPVTTPLATARTSVEAALRLDAIGAAVETARAAALAGVDEVSLARWVDALVGFVQAALPGPDASHGAPLGRLVLLLTGDDGLIDPRTAATVSDWISGRAESAAILAAAGAVRDELETLRAHVAALDPTQVMAELQPGHDAVAAAIAALPADGDLRRRLEPLLPPSPATLTAPLTAALGDTRAAVTGSLSQASQLAGFDLRRVDAAITSLGTALAPLQAFPAWASAWVTWAGTEVDPANLGAGAAAALATLATQLRTAPGLLLEAGLREQLRTSVGTMADAITGVLDDVRGLLDTLDPEPLVAGLEAAHTAKRAELAAFRPSTRLADVAAALATLEHDLRSFDPLADVRPVLAAFGAAVDGMATELAPTKLLAPVLDAYQRTAGAIASADIDRLFGPVLDGLHHVTQEVDDGLGDVGTAFARLQEALPAPA